MWECHTQWDAEGKCCCYGWGSSEIHTFPAPPTLTMTFLGRLYQKTVWERSKQRNQKTGRCVIVWQCHEDTWGRVTHSNLGGKMEAAWSCGRGKFGWRRSAHRSGREEVPFQISSVQYRPGFSPVHLQLKFWEGLWELLPESRQLWAKTS